MIIKRKKAFLLAASVLGVSGTLAFAQDAETQAELDALRARIEALESTGPGATPGEFRSATPLWTSTAMSKPTSFMTSSSTRATPPS